MPVQTRSQTKTNSCERQETICFPRKTFVKTPFSGIYRDFWINDDVDQSQRAKLVAFYDFLQVETKHVEQTPTDTTSSLETLKKNTELAYLSWPTTSIEPFKTAFIVLIKRMLWDVDERLGRQGRQSKVEYLSKEMLPVLIHYRIMIQTPDLAFTKFYKVLVKKMLEFIGNGMISAYYCFFIFRPDMVSDRCYPVFHAHPTSTAEDVSNDVYTLAKMCKTYMTK